MFYGIVRTIARILLLGIMRVKVEGSEHIPKKGPAVLCANHLSYWDPPAIGAICRRPVVFMAKEEFFATPFFGWLLRRLGAFPVKRGRADRAAIRKSLQVLDEGKVLALFPEGYISFTGQIQEAKPGVGLIVKRSEAPVVPIALSGGYHLLRKVTVGEPVSYDQLLAKTESDRTRALGEQIMSEIADIKREHE